MRIRWLLPALVAVALPLAGCGAGQGVPAGAPASGPSAAVSSPASAGASPVSAGAASVSAGAAPVKGLAFSMPQQLTPSDNGKRFAVKAGGRFTVALGTAAWTVQVADQSVLSRVPNIMVVRGAQGVYEAHKVGTTTLSAAASGSTPFKVTIEVLT